MEVRHILCAIDGSAPSLRAAALSAHIASGLGAQLTLIAVRCLHTDRTAASGIHTPEEIQATLNEAMGVVRENGCVGAEIVQLSARDVAVAIADYAKEHEINLIFMGSTGRSNLGIFAFGSTSLDVLHKSACPVTIVH